MLVEDGVVTNLVVVLHSCNDKCVVVFSVVSVWYGRTIVSMGQCCVVSVLSVDSW